MTQLCEWLNYTPYADDYINSTITPSDYLPLFKQYSFKYPIRFCENKKEEQSCKKLLTEVLTNSGICYTVNIIDASEIFRDVM